MAKKLTFALCALVLVGCAQTVSGKAVVDDAWDGQGVTRAPVTTTAAATPSAFDPCGLDEITLRIAVGVDPASKIEVPGGCGWSGETTSFASMLVGTLPSEVLPDTPGVEELVEIQAGGATVQVFAFEGDSCVARTEMGRQTLQFTMLEEDFGPYCIRLRVAAKMLLEDD